MKYTLIYSDGITPISAWQGMNFDAETGRFTGPDVREVASLAEARDQFALMSRQRMRDHVATVDGGPEGHVYLAPLSPDDEPTHRITQTRLGRARSSAA